MSASPKKTIRYRPNDRNYRRIRIVGQHVELGGDLYFALLNRPLWQFCLAIVVAILFINSVFAAIYMIEPGSISHARDFSFEDAFFFSVQTLATIGYGNMAPQTRTAHVVVTIESILGVLAIGSLAGVAFARLSRPRARVVFSEKIVIRPRNGVPHLQVRIANWRTNLIVEATVRLFVLVSDRTLEGETTRKPVELKLVRSFSPAFFLSWTVMHAIEEGSPFFAPNALDALREQNALLFVALAGYDQTLGQTVHAYWQYPLDTIVPNARFVDILSPLPEGGNQIDFSAFHDVLPL